MTKIISNNVVTTPHTANFDESPGQRADNQNTFRLRAKRKDGKESSKTRSPNKKSFLSSYDHNDRYRQRYKFKTGKDWAILVLAVILALLWICLKGKKKVINSDASTSAENNKVSAATSSIDIDNQDSRAITISTT